MTAATDLLLEIARFPDLDGRHWPSARRSPFILPATRLLWFLPDTLKFEGWQAKDLAHFNSFIRIPFLVLRQSIAPLPGIGTFEADVLKMRVWPNDIDFNFHLNNARHLSVMDYGRIHLLARGGVIKPVLKAGWVPVVGAVWITYRRSLPLWARFELSTRLVGWDNRWFYMEQVFTGDEGLVAVGWVKGALRGKNGAVPPQQVMEIVRPGIVSPELPEAIRVLNDLTRDKLQSNR